MTRKASSRSNTSTSVATATTKSLSSNTNFTLPSPTNLQGKPKWIGPTEIFDRGGQNDDRIVAIPEQDDDGDDVWLEFDEPCVHPPQHQHDSGSSSFLRPLHEPSLKPPSTHSQSIQSECSGRSSGSITLGGAASLSSNDTFQNSSILPLDHSHAQLNGSILKRDEAEDIQSQTTLPHSNINSPSGQLPHSIQRYHLHGHLHRPILEEAEWSSSSSSGDDDIVSNSNPQPFVNPKPTSPTTRKSGSTSPRKKTMKTTSPKSKSPKPQKSKSSAESPSKTQAKSPKKNSKSKGRNSPKARQEKNPSPRKAPKVSLEVEQEDPLHNSTEMSYISTKWTSQSLVNSNPTKFSSGHWANGGLDLSSWQSSDDDSSVDKPSVNNSKVPPKTAAPLIAKKKRFPKHQSNWKSPLLFEEEKTEKQNAPSPSFPDPQMTTVEGKPRSAYDKNAEWYCGSDDDEQGSIISDGSSVLSAFRPKKQSPVSAAIPESEASMDLGALLGGDDEQGSLVESSTGPEESMGLNFLLPQQQQEPDHSNLQQSASMSMGSMLPDLGEESIQSVSIRERMNEPIQSDDFRDVEAAAPTKQKVNSSSVPRSIIASETETCSHPRSEASMGGSSNNGGDDDDENEEVEGGAATSWTNNTLTKRLFCSQGTLRGIAVGVVLILLLDIVLLSIFVSRRN